MYGVPLPRVRLGAQLHQGLGVYKSTVPPLETRGVIQCVHFTEPLIPKRHYAKPHALPTNLRTIYDFFQVVPFLQFFFCNSPPPPRGPGAPHLRGFQITLNGAPQSVGLLWTSDQLVAETSTSQHTTRQTSIPLVGFEPKISVGERPQTYALDRAATGTGLPSVYFTNILSSRRHPREMTSYL